MFHSYLVQYGPLHVWGTQKKYLQLPPVQAASQNKFLKNFCKGFPYVPDPNLTEAKRSTLQLYRDNQTKG